MSKRAKKISGSINDWAHALEKAGLQHLAKKLSETEEVKIAGLKKLKQLGLPHLRKETLPLPTFLDKPEKYFDSLSSQKYYVNLISDIKNKGRMRSINLSRSQVLDFIKQNVEPAEISHFTFILYEYFDNLYGGNIVINSDGSFLLEIIEGTHGELVTGEKTPALVVEGNSLGKVHYYSITQDEKGYLNSRHIKNIAMKALDCIPTVAGTNRYHPGYYEFVIVKKNAETPLLPIFIDYRDKSTYQFNF